MALAISVLQLVFDVSKMPRTELNLGDYVNLRFSSGDSRFSSRDDRPEFIVLAGEKLPTSTSTFRLTTGFPAPEPTAKMTF
ncbi:hypothetical protein [Citrobacter sp. NCU1]|uniref:hypothetical protein n=1 Tax=Citrobacter sp. NCU1 TaxID=2026683 RepID=UPI0013907751|nr:hypothetical protein [Citrobacter sp. NCU1]